MKPGSHSLSRNQFPNDVLIQEVITTWSAVWRLALPDEGRKIYPTSVASAAIALSRGSF